MDHTTLVPSFEVSRFAAFRCVSYNGEREGNGIGTISFSSILMSVSSDPAVSDAQRLRRLDEHRAQGYESRAMPHIVFRPLHHLCPWPGCQHQIVGIDFQLELLGDEAAYERWLHSWWKGPGLVGRCPGCGNYVLFTMEQKVAIENPQDFAEAILPDDWFDHAYLLTR